jgi:hypothetical protein
VRTGDSRALRALWPLRRTSICRKVNASERLTLNVSRNRANSVTTPLTNLKEVESDFRNERDVVPAGIRTGPSPQIIFFVFLERWSPATRRPRARVFRVFKFLEFFRVFATMGVGFGQGSVPLTRHDPIPGEGGPDPGSQGGGCAQATTHTVSYTSRGSTVQYKAHSRQWKSVTIEVTKH